MGIIIIHSLTYPSKDALNSFEVSSGTNKLFFMLVSIIDSLRRGMWTFIQIKGSHVHFNKFRVKFLSKVIEGGALMIDRSWDNIFCQFF